MITLISGTNRPDSNTRKIADIVHKMLTVAGSPVTLLDLAALPPELFHPQSYGLKPETLEPFQEAILNTDGIMTVVPEYNGSFPGVMKYFIDMLRFPESLYEKPAGFVGISSGPWGAVRAVEQLEMIFQYRHAHLFGRRCFIPGISDALDGDNQLADPAIEGRLRKTVVDFKSFCRQLG